jgi:CRISPR-associated endonuclease cas1, NMENI subtype
MEPYRPYVDGLVLDIMSSTNDYTELTKDIKMKLLEIPVLDTMIGDKKSPLMIATQQTTASLYKCFSGEQRKMLYPEL